MGSYATVLPCHDGADVLRLLLPLWRWMAAGAGLGLMLALDRRVNPRKKGTLKNEIGTSNHRKTLKITNGI